MPTTETEVQGSIVHVVHRDNSGTDPVDTVLALTTSDGIGELTVEEEEQTVNLSRVRRTKRYRGANAPVIEIESLLDVDMEAASLLGITDGNGNLSFDDSDRRLGEDNAIRLEYYADEGASTPELVHELVDVETVNPSVNPSETPPIMGWTFWIHGPITLNA